MDKAEKEGYFPSPWINSTAALPALSECTDFSAISNDTAGAEGPIPSSMVSVADISIPIIKDETLSVTLDKILESAESGVATED